MQPTQAVINNRFQKSAGTSAMAQRLRAFALEAGKLGSILSRVKPKTLKLASAVTLAKRSVFKCSAEDEINGE